MATVEIIRSLFPVEELGKSTRKFEDDDPLWDELDPHSAPAAEESPIYQRVTELRAEASLCDSPLKRYKVDTE